jgi:16S rRNA A1518/A1519 N6-dimethyltransferase RsmA/KsgA/DIM1 with predicted DNA glycosylase/AP lyase activity
MLATFYIETYLSGSYSPTDSYILIVMEALRARFTKVFANLPYAVRSEIVVVIDNSPITWNVAYIEIMNQTEIGDKILIQLEELEII